MRIAREENDRLVEIEKHRHEEEFGGPVDLKWDGSNPRGTPQPSGLYHLVLKGTVFLKTDRFLELDIPFIHYGVRPP